MYSTICLFIILIVNIPQDNSSPALLYSKVFEEVEKIKSWKVKVDAETMQKERRLQENKRTIENQRKAIHELQVSILNNTTCHLFLIYQ